MAARDGRASHPNEMRPKDVGAPSEPKNETTGEETKQSHNRLAGATDGDSAEVSVYSGMDCIGRTVEQHRGEWTAFGADDQPFGMYPGRGAATGAIIAAAAKAK